MAGRVWPAQCLIGGEWVGNADSPVFNPSTGAEIARVPNFGQKETEQAVAAARNAFPGWSRLLAKERAAILRRWHDLVIQHVDQLGVLLTTEQGKPLAEAKAEILYAASYIEFYAEECKRVHGETLPTHISDGRIIVLRQPVGVVAAITPWNFPAAMVTRKIAPALAVGCTVVLKPAPETPLTAFALAELAELAGVPAGVLNLVTGDAVAIGQVLCASHDVRTLTFTGSTAIGKLLMAQCAPTVKRLGLELGGNAPFIVFDDADLDAAVDGAILSKFRNAGQTCVCANRIFVQTSIYDEFVRKFAEKASGLMVGDGFSTAVAIGPLINDAAASKVEAHIADAIRKGGTVITGGRRHAIGGNFFCPTVVANATVQMLVAQEETFGPLAPIFRFEDENEVTALANATHSGLAAYFYARDLGRVWRVAEALEYGMVAINSGRLSTELAPFGGVKESGLGREGSRHGLDEYLDTKYLLMAGL
ncbi:NAD-dependent succinate-semialdehyde dehydrogenase [Aureimonas fodinaquatilis]|uniref:NAD-dependent succinate-semialdehyde dehydrogenase n=1 Tax=Aureimonas fodinaquatilis TaxID=2565783 RepID=A0A5B0DSM1_9HYPH|nr:NAD-dependent succinate-semialdehyde dehydrogenase [Aureimonas fodinaquatilis]KAA0969814.1 NAD-dependent succinate-semialdehyde dehydrogenase [Aureimonas fodinaquatilis]